MSIKLQYKSITILCFSCIVTVFKPYYYILGIISKYHELQ